MDILQKYSAALKFYRQRNFDAAQKILDDVKIAAPHWKKSFLLEIYILRERGEYFKEFSALKNLLQRLNFTDEKILAADALSLFGSLNRELGFVTAAVESFRLSAKLEGVGEKACTEISNAIFAANSSENFSAADFAALYDDYKKYSADILPRAKIFYDHRRIRVGFLSADFQWHVAMAWSWNLLTELDKKFFAVYCYSSTSEADVVTENLRRMVDGWRDISNLTDEQAADKIRADEIDILFDLGGHTKNNRLRVLAHRPASVQISGVGYMNSTGLDCVDYFLSDVHCAGNPSAMREFFTEKIIILPQTHICYNSTLKEEISAPPCLAKGFVTFGSFNQFGKVTDSILRAWKKILDGVKNSRLILKHRIFNTASGRKFVSDRLQRLGFDIARVEMRPFTKNHVADYADVDIALDTYPYTGGVTTCEALFMGVPVVSLYGSRHGTRFGLSILANVGLRDLAVENYGQYIRRAIALAGDWNFLATLRQNLRGMMKNSPLMNSTSYVRAMEETFAAVLLREKFGGD